MKIYVQLGNITVIKQTDFSVLKSGIEINPADSESEELQFSLYVKCPDHLSRQVVLDKKSFYCFKTLREFILSTLKRHHLMIFQHTLNRLASVQSH